MTEFNQPGLFGPSVAARVWAGDGTLDLLAPDPDRFCVEAICSSLAATARYRGMTARGRPKITVAHHLLLCDWLAEWHCDRTAALRAKPDGSREIDFEWVRRAVLLHDFPEAYVGDLIAPLKTLDQFRSFREVENGILAAMHSRWLRAETPAQRKARFHLPDIVKAVDGLALRTEVCVAMPREGWSHFDADATALPEGARERLDGILADPDPEGLLLTLAQRVGVA